MHEPSCVRKPEKVEGKDAESLGEGVENDTQDRTIRNGKPIPTIP
jgi:hypothetical protein